MRIEWSEIAMAGADGRDGQDVEITGWPTTAEPVAVAAYVLLTPEPVCCFGCLPSDPLACVEVLASAPLPVRAGRLTLRGRWHRLRADPSGWRYQLTDAEMVGSTLKSQERPLGRRAVLAAPLLCLPATAKSASGEAPDDRLLDSARTLLANGIGLDMHSHAGSLLKLGHGNDQPPFTPLAKPMLAGGLSVVCLAVVSDMPTQRVGPDGRIHAFRNPKPGEPRACAYRGFRRLHALIRSQELRIATDAGSLAAARTAGPTVLVAAEGADFLEGDAAYLDPAYTLGSLRHLQLTHYRVNELGDIQTEAPIHGGLTPFGVEVVRRCQRMAIIVDVAHGTCDLVRQAVDVSTKPLVLSHTSLTSAPRPRTRMITSDHARLVAETGGVIDIWPPSNLFPSLEALADGIARMADVVGVAHVGVGSDMMGLVVPSILPSYENLPELVAFLLRRFSPAEVTGIAGANYMRVAKECLL